MTTRKIQTLGAERRRSLRAATALAALLALPLLESQALALQGGEDPALLPVLVEKRFGGKGRVQTSLMFSIKDRPGVLFHLLKPFADRNINLSKIESRPTKRKAWEYVFFVDVHGHRTDANIAEAVKELEPHCYWLRVLGSYPRDSNGKG